MPIPTEMTAIVARAPGAPEVLEAVSVPVPRPGPGEVLIRVQAAGVNRADALQRQGKYPVPAGATPVLGLEVAGEIVQRGEGAGKFPLGLRVCSLCNGGGYAQYVAVPETQVLMWPRNYDAIPSAALPEACFTVAANVFQAGRLHPRETLLIHGASGGVGVMAIQLARAAGAHVLVTSGRDDNCRYCVGVGAHRAINYRTEDFAAVAMQFTRGRGVDVILDAIGASYLEQNLAALAMDGRLVIIGFTGGRVAGQVDLTRILTHRLVITGSAMRPRSVAEKAALTEEIGARIWPHLSEGECKPVIAGVFPLAQAVEAHRRLETGGYFGKLILHVSD